MTIKELFEKAENGVFTFEQFEVAMTEANAKFVDMNTGEYVSKNKYTDDLAAKDAQITKLNGTISERNKDLSSLKTQLEEAGTDSTKLAELTGEFDTLKNKYDADTKAYKAQLKQQAYEFAVKEFANTKDFTSNAAKRDFISSMIAKELKMEEGKILGADDFVTSYSVNNADAFKMTEPEPEPNPNPEPAKPTFVSSTPGSEPAPQEQNAFLNAFHFTGVRPTVNNQQQ